MKYFLHIAYDGSKYRGWQCQPDVPTVQETLEEKLELIFKKSITVLGCGRTDAGVHASQYILHIKLEEAFDFDLKFRLNKHLPNDIVVYDVLEMEKKAHARFDAVSRTYDYFIHFYEDAFLHNYSSFYELKNLNVGAMKKAVALLSTQTEFNMLCKQPELHKSTVCTVTNAQVYVDADQHRLRFTITANRFLRGMVRIIVAYLLKVGKGEMTFEEFEKILAGQLKIEDRIPAFPNGLYLSRIEYPYLKIDNAKSFCAFLQKGLEE